jgi:Ala-tRNA(Pro) deacylase
MAYARNGNATDFTYDRLVGFLKDSALKYRIMDHAPEGQTARASTLRGHPLNQAAKCMVVEVRGSTTGIEYVLAVIPGDRRVDLRSIRKVCAARDASLADRALAEELTGCRAGCVTPISFSEQLWTIVDPLLLEQREIFFNAARLDRSVAMDASDLMSAIRASISSISKEVI